jgi:hypothetical protein
MKTLKSYIDSFSTSSCWLDVLEKCTWNPKFTMIHRMLQLVELWCSFISPRATWGTWIWGIIIVMLKDYLCWTALPHFKNNESLPCSITSQGCIYCNCHTVIHLSYNSMENYWFIWYGVVMACSLNFCSLPSSYENKLRMRQSAKYGYFLAFLSIFCTCLIILTSWWCYVLDFFSWKPRT